MKVFGYRVFALSVVSLMLPVAVTACGPGATCQGNPNRLPRQLSSRPASPNADTPSPVPAYPTATGDDLNLISQAITNTTVGNLKTYHYVMTNTTPLFPTIVNEGDYIQGVGDYTTITEANFEKEKLEEGNTSYCRDSSGKWIVEVPDLRARYVQAAATSEARMNENSEEGRFRRSSTDYSSHQL